MEQLDKHFIAVIGGFWELDKTDATKAAAQELRESYSAR